jgi:hypothetical protein
MRVKRIAGLRTLLGFGSRIQDAVGQRPAGLLRENLLFSLIPMHVEGPPTSEPPVTEESIYEVAGS